MTLILRYENNFRENETNNNLDLSYSGKYYIYRKKKRWWSC